jgi:hypothetical protein
MSSGDSIIKSESELKKFPAISDSDVELFMIFAPNKFAYSELLM